MPPNPPRNSRLPRLAVWSGYGTEWSKHNLLLYGWGVLLGNKAPSARIHIFLNPQIFLCRFKNSFHVHTFPYSNRICPSIRIRIHFHLVS